MEDGMAVAPEVSWKGGKKITTFPVGPDGWRVVVTEYFSLVERKLVPGSVTMKLERGVAR